MNLENIEVCERCGRPFTVSEIGGSMSGSKEREEIACPHGCRWSRTQMINGYFQTAALTEAQEEEQKRRGLSAATARNLYVVIGNAERGW